jgi:hypothetical protein
MSLTLAFAAAPHSISRPSFRYGSRLPFSPLFVIIDPQ